MRCSEVLEGVVSNVVRRERITSELIVGVNHSFFARREFHDVECRVDGHPAYLNLQADTALYLRSGDRVQVAGRLENGVLVVVAMRNLTDGSLYCWKTEGGRYRQQMKRLDRLMGWGIACLATPLIALFALETWPSSPMKAIAVVVGGAAAAWLTHKLGTLFPYIYKSGCLPGNAETESSAQALINVDAEEADRIIRV